MKYNIDQAGNTWKLDELEDKTQWDLWQLVVHETRVDLQKEIIWNSRAY